MTRTTRLLAPASTIDDAPARPLTAVRVCQCPCGCGVSLGKSLLRCVACRCGAHKVQRAVRCTPSKAA
jgi:hypothetical protein